MDIIRKFGSTSNVIRLMLRTADTDQGFTGINESTSGLKIAITSIPGQSLPTTYTSGGGTIEAVTGAVGTYQAPTSGKIRITEPSSSNLPGVYELHVDDSRFSVAGSKEVAITISGVSNLKHNRYTIQQTAADLDDSVDLGLSGLLTYSDIVAAVTEVLTDATVSLTDEAMQGIADAVAAILLDGAPISPIRVSKGRTWRFDSSEQTTATNQIEEIIGLDANLAMDFSEAMPDEDSLNTVTVLGVSPSSGLAIGTPSRDLTMTKAILPAVATVVGEYTVVVKAVTVDGQTLIKRGVANIQSLSGD